MILSVKNPNVDITKASNVYVVYLWTNPKTRQPEADLSRLLPNPGQTIEQLIKEIQAIPGVTFRGLRARLQDIYVDNQVI